jgi:PAS domain S-box-containing protein
MLGATTSTFSARRLGIGLAVQAVVTAIDVALSANPLTITGSVLLVPLVLAIVGDWREVAITGVVAFVIGVVSPTWNTTTALSQDVYRVGFFTVFAGLAVLAARTRQQATAMASANQELADELSATRARLDGILGAMAEAVTVHDETGQVVYGNRAAARLLGCASVDEVLRAAPEQLAAKFTITDEDGRSLSLDDMPGQRLMAGEDTPSLLTRSVRDDGAAFWLLTKATLYRDPSGARLAINVIEHLGNPRAGVANIWDALAPDGLCVVHLPTVNNLASRAIYRVSYAKDPTHVFRPSGAAVVELFRSEGFTFVEGSYAPHVPRAVWNTLKVHPAYLAAFRRQG